jgi:hypothetical protein
MTWQRRARFRFVRRTAVLSAIIGSAIVAFIVAIPSGIGRIPAVIVACVSASVVVGAPDSDQGQ